MAKSRVDALLVERGLFDTREKARAAVLAGAVFSGDQALTKPGLLVADSAEIVLARRRRYVSRGGEKLNHALHAFGVSVDGVVAADIGASTGGFSDCLLQHGAARVYAVDVGYGQFDYTLRRDPRVVVLERTNARYLSSLPEKVQLAAIDVSFISLTKILEPLALLLEPAANVIALVKPQFEGERNDVGRGGVVRDPNTRARILGRFVRWTATHDYQLRGLTRSPLKGPAGNVEFFVLLRPVSQSTATDAPRHASSPE